MQYSGCEIFAVYNTVYSLLSHPLMSLPELISRFEKDGMALGGKFGTSPKFFSSGESMPVLSPPGRLPSLRSRS